MLEAARLRELNLAKARLAKQGIGEARKEIKREMVSTAIERDVRHTDRKLAQLRAAEANHDPRTEVFLALRAAGKSIREATDEVERQFANQQPTEGE